MKPLEYFAQRDTKKAQLAKLALGLEDADPRRDEAQRLLNKHGFSSEGVVFFAQIWNEQKCA